MFRKKKKAIIVLGMHRSGTSLLTKILTIMGATPPSGLLMASFENPLGYWEAYSVIGLNKKLLSLTGNTWETYRAIPDNWLEEPERWDDLEAAVRIIEEEFGGADLIVLKCPRICRLMPFWESAVKLAGYDIATVKIIRDPEEVFLSLAARSILPLTKHAAITNPEHAALLWLRYVLDAERHSRNIPRVIINYANLVANKSAALKVFPKITEPNQLVLSEGVIMRIEALFSPELRRQRNQYESEIVTDSTIFDPFRKLIPILSDSNDENTPILDKISTCFNQIYNDCLKEIINTGSNENDNDFHKLVCNKIILFLNEI